MFPLTSQSCQPSPAPDSVAVCFTLLPQLIIYPLDRHGLYCIHHLIRPLSSPSPAKVIRSRTMLGDAMI